MQRNIHTKARNHLSLHSLTTLCLLICTALAACGTPTEIPQATERNQVVPEELHISLPLALEFLRLPLYTCAEQLPNAVLLLHVPLKLGDSSYEQLTPGLFSYGDLALWLGEPPAEMTGQFGAQVGWQQLVVVTNAANPIDQLSAAQLRDLYAGQVEDWSMLGGESLPAQVWCYPPGDPAGDAFIHAFAAARNLSPNTFPWAGAGLAPSPQAMLEAIAAEPGAIGYLPEGALAAAPAEMKGALTQVELDSDSETALRLPLLALSPGEPHGILRALLVCLQENLAGE
jgi:hypothetical protein